MLAQAGYSLGFVQHANEYLALLQYAWHRRCPKQMHRHLLAQKDGGVVECSETVQASQDQSFGHHRGTTRFRSLAHRKAMNHERRALENAKHKGRQQGRLVGDHTLQYVRRASSKC